jgi:RNA polymerase sigma-70 factor (ECF subfamily)
VTLSTIDIWEDFGERLRAFIGRRVSDPADAEDILQGIFLRVHTQAPALRDEQRLAPWLYRIARNAVIDHYRRQRQEAALSDEIAEAPDDPDEDPETRLAEGLRPMIACLPVRYRRAVILSELEGVPQREVAERLGISLSGAKSRVQRGRRLLREALVACCKFEMDRRGHVIDYAPRADCCDEAGKPASGPGPRVGC